MVVVIMGVSGSGKTTIGHLLADRLKWTFFDADDFHPESNVAKMKQGLPLNDEDRSPWLARLNREVLQEADDIGTGRVLACSALKERYRQALLEGVSGVVRFVHLTGRPEVIRSRMEARQHFMSPAMLDSQLACLEPPRDALVVDIASTPDCLVQVILDQLRLS